MENQQSRRIFLKKFGYGCTSLAVLGTIGCNNQNKKTMEPNSSETTELFFKISLAQWSLHRSFEAKTLKVEDFAAIAKDQFQIEAVEYVSSLYREHGGNESYFQNLNQRAVDVGVKNLLIMVDEEGDLGDSDKTKRDQAVENHHKWVNVAKIMDCSTIRVNAFGASSAEALSDAIIDGLGNLAVYAKSLGINIVIENHGLHSSNAKWVANVIQQINMDNCGTLPDFGNFCTAKKWGSTQNNDCAEAYDRYQGVAEMMPYAFGVSAKSYDFDEKGNETIIDYQKMLQIVKDANFSGHIGIEYEGSRLSEPEGILATKALLEKVGMAIG